jgi:hypothetical protein
MPLLKKLSWLLVGLIVTSVVAILAFVDNPGRPAAATITLGSLSWLIVARIAHGRHTAVLRQAAANLGLEYVAGAGEEKSCAFLAEMRQKSEADVFRWKVDGKFPAIAGVFAGFPVAVRVPIGVDFDAGAPDSTRIVAYHSIKMTGLTIYDRSRIKKTPKGRQATTGEETFDARFLILAHRAEEAATVIGPEARKALLAAGSVGFRGIEVNRYGVFLYEEGKISSAELLRRRLELVTTLAEAAKELGKASARA